MHYSFSYFCRPSIYLSIYLWKNGWTETAKLPAPKRRNFVKPYQNTTGDYFGAVGF
ncbi:MAG: hypothetical protein LBD53_00335 [Tannerella sp.]|nr:hypothetical protein [Tannerella sp.]